MAISPDFKLNGKWAKYVTCTRNQTRAYNTYTNMVNRTKPGGKVQSKKPAYIGTTNGFGDFQSFANWSVQQVGYGVPGYQLDKDLLVKGNKVYSPENCCFLPGEINSAITRDHCDKRSGPVSYTHLTLPTNREV